MSRKYLPLLILALWFMGGDKAEAAPTFHASTTFATTTLTANHFYTTPAGSNLVTYICISPDNQNKLGPVISYNGSFFEQVTSVYTTPNFIGLYRLVNPSVGGYPLLFSGMFNGSENNVVVLTLSDVDQEDPDDNPITTSAASGTTSSLDVTSAVGDLVIDCMGVNNHGAVNTLQGVGQTQVVGDVGTGATSMEMSTKPGAASVTMSWSGWGSARNGQVAVSVNAPYTFPEETITNAYHGWVWGVPSPIEDTSVTCNTDNNFRYDNVWGVPMQIFDTSSTCYTEPVAGGISVDDVFWFD